MRKRLIVRLISFALLVGASGVLILSYRFMGFWYTVLLFTLWKMSGKYTDKYLD